MMKLIIINRHKVVNFLVRTAQSQCYPNCEELYGVQGAGPHTHNLGANITTEMENRNYKKGGSVTGRKKMPRKRVKRRMQMGGQTCPSGQRMQNGTCVSIGGTIPPLIAHAIQFGSGCITFAGSSISSS